MDVHKIAVIPGDGVGPEVIREGVRVLEEAARLDGGFRFEFTWFPWGCGYYLKHGRMMEEDGISRLEKFDAIYLGGRLSRRAGSYFPVGFAADNQEKL